MCLNLKNSSDSFCLLHFKDETNADCFYHTYTLKNICICKRLDGLYVQEVVFNGVKATYDIASLHHRRYHPSATGCCCINTTQYTTIPWDPIVHAQPVHIKTEPNIKPEDALNTNECLMSSLARLQQEVVDDEKVLKSKYEKTELLERLIALG